MILLWISLAILAGFSLILWIGDRLLKQSLAHAGICPMCHGEGGPCNTCNGFGMIVDVATTRSPLPQPNNCATTAETIEN